MTDTLKLDAQALTAFLLRAVPDGDEDRRSRVVAAAPGRVRMVLPSSGCLLRPGGVVSGPTMMSLADVAAYALVLAHVGEEPMAVTTSLTMHFLRPARPGDLHAEASLLKLGRRIATSEIALWTETPERAAARAIVAYAIPS